LSSRLNKPLFLAYVLCSLAAVFYLPYLVPMHPTASDSYLFGYNNHAGVVLLLLLVTIGSIWTEGLNLKLPSTGASKSVSRTTLAWSLLAVLLGCAVMYMLAARFGGTYETGYEMDRGWMLSIGKVPYVDFEWPFGVAFLYGPLLLRNRLPINLVQAYYLFWLLNWLLGTLLLYAVINMVDYPTNSKRSIFLLLYSGGFFSIIFMGTHYTFLRYTCPLFFILVVHKVFKSVGDRSRVYAALLAIAFTIILLLISPEIAIAHAFACVCIFLRFTPRWNAGSLATFIGLLLAFAALLSGALKLHVLDTVMASGGGADSFPILLSPHILLFSVAVFCCACYVFRSFAERCIQDNTIGLVAFSIPMIAAALGRCDPFHTFWNGEGIYVASMFYLSGYKVVWRWYKAAFVVILVILPLRFVLPIVQKAIVDSITNTGTDPTLVSRSLIYLRREYISTFASPAEKARWQSKHTNSAKIIPDKIDLAVLYPTSHEEFLAPLGYKPNGTGTYLSNEIDYGHFEAFENANTVVTTRTKLAEIENHPEKALLLPGGFEIFCMANVPVERHLISLLFSFPYFGKIVHPESVHQPVCSYILDHYKLETAPAPQNFNYGLWVRKSTQPSR
jgi:hypothetical protein